MVHHVPCAECSSHTLGLFGCLNEPELARLTESRISHTYATGQALFYEGTPALAIYCIREGTVKLWRNGHGGDQIVIRMRGKGDVVGARSVFAGGLYPVTAEALGPLIACTIPGEAFVRMVQGSQRLANALLKKLATEAIETEDALLARMLCHVQQRTARFLLHIAGAERESAEQPIVLRLPWNREEMANLIGTTPETLSRTLHAFAAKQVLEIKRDEIRVLDLPSLRRTAR